MRIWIESEKIVGGLDGYDGARDGIILLDGHLKEGF